MSSIDRFRATAREHLESLGEALVTDVAALLAELDDLRDRIAASEAEAQSRQLRLQQLEDRANGQSELIETMRQEAEESQGLRELVLRREIEIEKAAAELESKREIITALRRQLADLGDLKAAVSSRDETIAAQQDRLEQTARELAGVRQELESRRTDATEAAIDQAELAALKSELEARKAQIKTLRSDAARVEALEIQLDDSRAAAAALEDTINQHVETITRLKQSISTWKHKYRSATGESLASTDATSRIAPFSESEAEVLAELEQEVAGSDCTVTIDMSQALHEARRRRAARAEP